MILKVNIALFLLILLSCNDLLGQMINVDSFFIRTSKEKAINMYFDYMDDQLSVFNGWEYKDYDRFIEGDQFFLTNEAVEGSVTYDGVTYPNLQIRYDIANDVVVLRHPSQSGYISDVQIPGNRISSFSILEHDFIRIESDSITDTNLSSGFYDLIHDSEYKVLAKRIKSLVESAGISNVEKEFIYKERFYVFKDGEYYPIRGRRSFLKIFPERKKEIRRFMRRNNLRFSEDKEKAIKGASHYYDQLN